MTVSGVDYAWARPSPQCLYSNGKRFVCRYLSFDTNGKNLTHGEALALSHADLWITCNWEALPDAGLDGYATGVKHARKAAALAEECGQPSDRPIYFSMDFDATARDLARSADYFDGVHSAIGYDRTGVYGGYRTVEYFHRNQLAPWLWQTYAWSAGKIYSGIHILQYRNGVTTCGGKLDLDRAYQADYGQWSLTMADAPKGGSEGDTSTTEASWDYSQQIAGTATEFQTLTAALAVSTQDVADVRSN